MTKPTPFIPAPANPKGIRILDIKGGAEYVLPVRVGTFNRLIADGLSALDGYTFNVRDGYGAIGDGIADDSLAVQAAINDAQLFGGTVFFPAGTYLIGQTVTISTGNILLSGVGFQSVLRIKAGTQANALLLSGCSNVQIRNLSIDGNMANVDTGGAIYATICTIRAVNVTNLIIENCYLTNGYYGGLILETCTDVLIRNNRCVANRDNGIFVHLNNTNVTIIGNHVSGSTFSGIQAVHSNYINVIGNVAYNNGPAPSSEGDGIGFEGCLYSSIVGNTIYGNSTQGIKVDYTTEGSTQRSAHILIEGNHLYNNGITRTDSGIAVLRSDYVSVKNNYVYANYYGLNIGQVTHMHLEGNTIVANQFQGIRQYDNTGTGPMTVLNNRIEANGSHGIDAQITTHVLSNWLLGNTGEGVRLSGGNNWLIQNNILLDNTDNGILVAAGSNHEVKDNLATNSASAQARLLFESAGGPTFIEGNRIVNQGTADISLSNAASQFVPDRTKVKIVTAGPTYAAAYADHRIIVNKATGSATTVTLPTGFPGMEVTVKDGKGDAATNNITVNTSSAQTIDGAASVAINTNFGLVRLFFNGTQWNVI